MPRKRKKRQSHDDRYSRSLVFKPNSNEERDLFLEMGLPLTEELDVLIDTSPGRIEIELRGSYIQVDNVLSKLRKLQIDIVNALYPDRHGFYHYNEEILTQICRPPVNLDLFAAAISVFKFASSHKADGNLQTQAPIEDLTSIHQKIVTIRNEILGQYNKDIERFFVIIALAINSDDIGTITEMAKNLQLIKETNYGFQFTVAEKDAKQMLLEKLGIEIGEAQIIDGGQELDDFDFGDLGFGGGKIVFFKDGKEIDPDEMDDM